MKRIVVTGATSMIGVALINKAIKDQDIEKVYAIVRHNTEKINRLAKSSKIQIIHCDNDDYGKLVNCISYTCDVFYHLAWPRTATYDEKYEDIKIKSDNIQIVLETIKIAHELGCQKYIGAGSQSEYGIGYERLITPSDYCNPVRADGIIHLAAGKLGAALAAKYGMDYFWVRIFSIYGKNDRDNSMISSTVRKMMNGEKCAFTSSEQMWDYLNEEDAGEAFYCIGKNAIGNKVYCLGSGKTKKLKEYIETIKSVVAPSEVLTFGEVPYPDNPVMFLGADISALIEDTGWYPKIDFKTGIEKIYNALREKG